MGRYLEQLVCTMTINISPSKSNLGAISEACFVMAACRNNWDICKPIHDAHGYDFVIRRDHQWETVQVKTVTRTIDARGYAPSFRVNLKRLCNGIKRLYTAGDFDWLGAVYKNEVWLIPFSVVADKGMISVRSADYEQFKLL